MGTQKIRFAAWATACTWFTNLVIAYRKTSPSDKVAIKIIAVLAVVVVILYGYYLSEADNVLFSFIRSPRG